ncbi:hypothetical protein FHS57_002378 [Runella defluvii]|uniref:G8 domain-containing protein n=1 Tax=Runella defluvii TaxID=370973 RepID=A0A7W5ZK62_9BACT|nr:hypothetical protein [Runella defluvii]MBB3838373.1 hypothetical protein [Runella defluvii]
MNTILLPFFSSRLWLMPVGIVLLLLGQNTFAQSTWNGISWSNGAPTATVDAIIASSVAPGSFTAKTLTISSGVELTINTDDTVILNGSLTNYGNGVSGVGHLRFVANGSLLGNTLNFNGVLSTAAGATLTTGGRLRLTSNATNTGSIGNSQGAIIGDITIERYIPGGRRAFRFFAHPFAGSLPLTQLTDDIDITGNGGTVNGFSTSDTNNPSAFWFNTTTGDNSTSGNNPGWSAFTSTNGTGVNAWGTYGVVRVLVRGAVGEGLSQNSYTPSPVTIDLTGSQIKQGSGSIPFTRGTNTNFVIVGNPYAASVNVDAIIRTNIGSAFFVWDAYQGTKGGYTSYTFGSSNFVMPIFGSFITTLTASSGSCALTEAMKRTSTPTIILNNRGDNTYGLQLRLEDSTTFWDRMVINFDNNSQSGDDYFDAQKLENPEVNFYCRSSNGKNLSIDSRPFVDAEVLSLGLVTPVKQGFKIKAENFNLPAGTRLFLNDRYLDKKMEITGNGFEYWFNVNEDATSSGNGRFELITQGQLLPSASSLTITSDFNITSDSTKDNSKVNLRGVHSIKN